jgi:hypothetical protein
MRGSFSWHQFFPCAGMRSSLIILFSLFLISSCSNDSGRSEATTGHTSIPAKEYDTIGNPRMNDEVIAYRDRLSKRVSELEKEIGDLRRKSETEKDIKERQRVAVVLRQKEEAQGNFRRSLQNFDSRSSEGWENFRRELDTLFNRDIKNRW